MNDLVDLHTHVLSGLDDGPEDIHGSLEMLQALEELGFTHVFATPHHRLHTWEGLDPGTVEARVRDLSRAAVERGIGVNLLPGMEFDLDESLPSRASMAPGSGTHILVDAGFWGVPRDLTGMLGALLDSGLEVLLVHPERNRDLCRFREGLSELMAMGVRIVGNIGSFSGMYGHEVREGARSLLVEGYYWAAASDLHSAHQARWIEKGMRELALLAGSAAAEELMAANPMQMVRLPEEKK